MDRGAKPKKKKQQQPRAAEDDGGLAVVRIKPLGAGGGGGERSAAGVTALHATDKGVVVTGDPGSSRGTVSSSRGGGRLYSYPRHVCAARHDNAAIYDMFMPQRVELFLKGTNVNIMAYGQTGSGKPVMILQSTFVD